MTPANKVGVRWQGTAACEDNQPTLYTMFNKNPDAVAAYVSDDANLFEPGNDHWVVIPGRGEVSDVHEWYPTAKPIQTLQVRFFDPRGNVVVSRTVNWGPCT